MAEEKKGFAYSAVFVAAIVTLLPILLIVSLLSANFGLK